MLERRRLKKIFLDLDRYFEDLASLNVISVEDLNDCKTFYAASMLLFSVLNLAIDLDEEVVAGRKLGVPSSYRDIFRLLVRNGLLDSKLEKEMSALVGYRNLLAHEYHQFSEENVFEVLQRVGSVRLFSERMADVVCVE